MRSICILGRQPALGLAELESLYGAGHIAPWGPQAALLDIPVADIAFSRLGGSTRLCQELLVVPSTQWETVINAVTPTLNSLAANLPEGKIRLGLSYCGKGPTPRVINATGLSLKKAIKAAGRSVRLVPNTAAELNTAQILHNQLTGPTGIELVFVPYANQTLVARTIATQDITAYAARDQKRPKRDARVGMLPPKLAQIIINLATGPTPTSDSDSTPLLLDPFCGTGVLLQEALLHGFTAYGTDIEPRMIEFSDSNLAWITERQQLDPAFMLAVGDATNYHWQPFDVIACETYLGRPLNTIPRLEKLAEIMQDCDVIHRKFLQNLAAQTKPGFRACIAVPAWKTSVGFKHLKTLDNLPELGYNRLRFVHVDTDDLIYHRPDQVVARELVILQRK